MGFLQDYWLSSSLLLYVLLSGLWWWNHRAKYSDFGVSYLTVFAEAKYYKVLSAPFFHASIWHLLINSFLLIAGLAPVEAQRGSAWVLPHLLLFAVSVCSHSCGSPRVTCSSAQITSPAFMYWSQWYIGTRSLWFGHMIHKQVYAGFSGALVATLLLAAVTDVQSSVDPAAATQLNDAIHKSMLQLAHNGTLPNSAVHSTTDGTIVSPLVLAVPIVSGLAMQLCVRDVSVLGTLGSLVLAILAAMAGTVDGSVSLMLQYWAYSTFIIVVFLSLPSAVASGLLPQSAVCTAALTTWQRPDAAVIKRNIELGESREATGTMFGNSDSASTSVGPGVASRMPLNVHTDGAAIAITGTAPLNDSDSEEEPDNEQAASAARYGSTWHIPRDDGGSIVVFHSGETCVSSQARAPVTASSAAPHTGRSLHPRWRVFVPPPRRLDGASAPQLPREHASSAPVSWSFSRWWPFGHTTPSTATHGSPVEAAPLLSSGNVEEAVARAGAGNDSAAQGTPGQQGVSGLGIDSTDVDLFDMAGDDSDGSTRGHFLGGGEEQGSRGGTGTTPHSRPAQRPKEYNK